VTRVVRALLLCRGALLAVGLTWRIAAMGLLETADWTGKIFNGGWVAANGGTLTSTEPATGQVLGRPG
jgi:hypothetical protein